MFVGDDKSLLERLEELQKRFDAVGELTNQTNQLTDKTARSTAQGIGNVTLAEETIERAFESFKVSSLTNSLSIYHKSVTNYIVLVVWLLLTSYVILTRCRRLTQKCVIADPRVVDGPRISAFSYTTSNTRVFELVWHTDRFKVIVSYLQDVWISSYKQTDRSWTLF